MRRVVLDASLMVATCIGEAEAVPLADAVLEVLHDGQAIVPAIWLSEVANVFVSRERTARQALRLQRVEVDAFLSFVESLPVFVDAATPQVVFGRVASLARSSGLTVYDALYLELAQRLAAPLGSLDDQLCRAARAAGVEVLSSDSLRAWRAESDSPREPQ